MDSISSQNRYSPHLQEVRKGDLLFNFRSERISAKIISATQRVFAGLWGHSGGATHVGIVVGKGEEAGIIRVAEATGAGQRVQVIELKLEDVENKKEGLTAVHIEDEQLSEKVAEVAHQWASAKEEGGNFNVGHLLTSVGWLGSFDTKNRIEVAEGVVDTLAGTGRLAGDKGIRRDYYCSEFVVEVYQTAKALLAIDDASQKFMKDELAKETSPEKKASIVDSTGSYLHVSHQWPTLEKDPFFAQSSRASTPGRLLHQAYEQTRNFGVISLFNASFV